MRAVDARSDAGSGSGQGYGQCRQPGLPSLRPVESLLFPMDSSCRVLCTHRGDTEHFKNIFQPKSVPG